MHRLSAAFLLGTLTVGLAGVGNAQVPSCGVTDDRDGSSFNVECRQRDSHPGAAPRTYPYLIVEFGPTGGGPDGKTCFALSWGSTNSEETARRNNARNEARLAEVEARPDLFVNCTMRPDGTPVDPRFAALQCLATVTLPAPQPHIAPGWGLAGKAAFLEANSPVTYTAQVTCAPFGLLVADLESEIWVDWDDSHHPGRAGPYRTAGAPWPDGEITHVYQDADDYTITVYQQWVARWRLAGHSGTVPGLETQGTLDFDVREVQAVRNR
jgi:hypothetical protein